MHSDTPTPPPDARATARHAWAQRAIDALAGGDGDVAIERASADAGFRSYWRATRGGASWIVMDSPPELEDVRPWLRVRAQLLAGGVRVPTVLAEDADTGFLLLEDLGSATYLHVIDEGNADDLFDAAVEQLLRIQALPVPADLPAYDETLLARELRLFDDWYLAKHLGMSLDCTDMEALDIVGRRLMDAALVQPQVVVHRDFMPRNLMPCADGPAVLDFQDAVRGPIAYDPISLWKDAFLSWPAERVGAWLARYHERARAAGLPVPERARFLRDADWIGVQRHLKIIGIFARLHHRDGKPKYLADVPRFFDYLDAVLPKYREFEPLATLIERRVKPAMAAAS